MESKKWPGKYYFLSLASGYCSWVLPYRATLVDEDGAAVSMAPTTPPEAFLSTQNTAKTLPKAPMTPPEVRLRSPKAPTTLPPALLSPTSLGQLGPGRSGGPGTKRSTIPAATITVEMSDAAVLPDAEGMALLASSWARAAMAELLSGASTGRLRLELRAAISSSA